MTRSRLLLTAPLPCNKDCANLLQFLYRWSSLKSGTSTMFITFANIHYLHRELLKKQAARQQRQNLRSGAVLLRGPVDHEADLSKGTCSAVYVTEKAGVPSLSAPKKSAFSELLPQLILSEEVPA